MSHLFFRHFIVFLKYCHFQVTVYFFNDENFRLTVKLNFLSSKQWGYLEVFSCTNVLRILEPVADFSKVYHMVKHFQHHS